MLYLADENFPAAVVKALREGGHDVRYATEDLAQTPDSELLAIAQEEGRIILTQDKDFGELAFKARLPAEAGVVLFRIHDVPIPERNEFILAALRSELEKKGRFTVVSSMKIRQVPLL